jgi:hypothetical protein
LLHLRQNLFGGLALQHTHDGKEQSLRTQ